MDKYHRIGDSGPNLEISSILILDFEKKSTFMVESRNDESVKLAQKSFETWKMSENSMDHAH